jgi:uncharacterized RDD family membrane protein YckC
MTNDSLEDALLHPAHDPLNRPLPAHLVPEIPSAGDVMLANFWQRSFAFLADIAFIFFLCCSLLWICNYYDLLLTAQQVTLVFCVVWAAYVVMFSISRCHATLGQLMMGIHLYSLFNSKISSIAAFVRFLLMATPSMTMMYVTMVYLFPDNFSALKASDKTVITPNETVIFMVLTIAGLAQLAMLWPLLSGHYRRIVWDNSLRCCVVRKRLV